MITLNSDEYLRMVSEKANLEKKVEKLDAFIKKALNVRIQRVFEAHK